MKPHVYGDNWTRVHRMMLALIQWDEDSYRFVMSELGDCPRCLRDALHSAIHLHANNFALQAGGLDKAADVVAGELERLILTE